MEPASGNGFNILITWCKRHRVLLLFALCFILPFGAAKIALAFALYTPGVAARGQWLDQEIQLLDDSRRDWRLAYVAPDPCDTVCGLAIQTLQQLYLGLGAHQSSVYAEVIANQPPERLHPALHWQPKSWELAAVSLDNQLLILNREGIVLLRYPVAVSADKAPALAKDIRSDLLRLLNYDRAGP